MLGTLAIQGLTLKPLIRALDLQDKDPVGHEFAGGAERALEPGSRASSATDRQLPMRSGRSSPPIWAGRRGSERRGGGVSAHHRIHRAALAGRAEAVLAMRASDEIGDDAFHRIEEELDWLEMAGSGN